MRTMLRPVVALVLSAAAIAPSSPPAKPPFRLLFLETTEECPKAAQRAECRRLTSERYKATGVNVIPIAESDLTEWLAGDGRRMSKADREMQLIAFTKSMNADAIGGISYYVPATSPSRNDQSFRPVFYGWIINRRSCRKSHGIILEKGTRVRAIPLREGLSFPDDPDAWTIPDHVTPVRPSQISGGGPGKSESSQPGLGLQTDGATVTEVLPGTPADKLGLRHGDVMVSVAATPVSSLGDIIGALEGKQVGESVEIEWRRDGETKRNSATLIDLIEFRYQRQLSFFKKPIPDLSGVDIAGNPVRLHDFKGKSVVLSFWATWCGPCRLELPLLQMTWERLQAEPFAWIHVSVDQDDKAWRDFVKNNALGGIQVREPQWATNLGIDGYPETYLLDERGILRLSLHQDIAEYALGAVKEAREKSKKPPRRGRPPAASSRTTP